MAQRLVKYLSTIAFEVLLLLIVPEACGSDIASVKAHLDHASGSGPAVQEHELSKSHAKYLEPSNEVRSPHVIWMKTGAKKAMHVLFITPRLAMREIVELNERFDFDRDVFVTAGENEFAISNAKVASILPGTGTEDSASRLRQKLRATYDCIVVGDAWPALPEWAQRQILEKVKAGTGLVARVSFGKGLLADAMKSDMHANGTDVLGAFPYKALGAYRTWPDFDSFFNHSVQCAQYGKGRVALIADTESATYPRRMEQIYPGRMQFITPEVIDAFPTWKPIFYDYYLAMVGKLMQWSTGKPPRMRVVEPELSVDAVDRENLNRLTFEVSSDCQQKITAKYALRTANLGEVLATGSSDVNLNVGSNRIEFPIERLPSGSYLADLWVKDGAETICFGSIYMEVTGEARIARIRLSQPSYSIGEAIHADLDIDGAITGDVAEVRHRDNFGRLIAHLSKVFSKDGRQTIHFQWTAATPLSIMQFIEVTLRRGSEALDKVQSTFFINNIEPDRRDVRWVLAQDPHVDSFLDFALAQATKNAGFDSWTYAGGWEAIQLRALAGTPWAAASSHSVVSDAKLIHAGSALTAGLRLIPIIQGGDEHDYDGGAVTPRSYASDAIRTRYGMARRPCIIDPAFVQRRSDLYQGAARRLRNFSIPEYDLGDECALLAQNEKDVDVCFCDRCIEDFRSFVRQQYGTIEKLNREYGTAYKSFAEVLPVALENVRQRKDIPAWIDHRRRMEHYWASYFSTARDSIKQIDPHAKVGYDGSDEPGHIYAEKVGGGENYYLLAHSMDMNGLYYYPLQLDCVRDFSAPGTQIGGGWYGGYPSMWRAGRDSLHHRWWLWNSLMRGANMFWVFEGLEGGRSDGNFDVIAPDFSFYDFFKSDIEEMRAIKGGVGKLILTSQRPDDGIAILYSTPSMLLTTFTEGFPKRWDSASAAPFLLTEAGFQYRMLADEELDRGMLNEKKFRALYLPYCQAISRKGASEILRFAENGGTVIADLRPAVSDEHGKPYESGALDALFGVRQVTSQPSPVMVSPVLSKSFGELKGSVADCRADGSLQLQGAMALATAGDVPSFIVHEYGKGKAVLFNLAISDWMSGDLVYAPRFADNKKAETARELIRASLERSGVRPEVTLDPEVPGCHVWRHQCGDGLMLGLLWDAPGFLPGMDWSNERALDDCAKQASKVALRLPHSSYVYDVLNGQYLGKAAQIDRIIRPGVFQLLAALPEKVGPLSVVVTEKPVAGKHLEYKVVLTGAARMNGVFRVEFTNPNGQLVDYYTANLPYLDGQAVGHLNLAMDEVSGRWLISVRDVASGTRGAAAVNVISEK